MWLYVHNKLTLAMSSASHSLWKRENYIHHFQLLYFSSAISFSVEERERATFTTFHLPFFSPAVSFSVEERDLHLLLSPPFFSPAVSFSVEERVLHSPLSPPLYLSCDFIFCRRERSTFTTFTFFISLQRFSFLFLLPSFCPPLSFSSPSFHEISKSRKKGGAGSWGGDRGGGVGIDGIFPSVVFVFSVRQHQRCMGTEIGASLLPTPSSSPISPPPPPPHCCFTVVPETVAMAAARQRGDLRGICRVTRCWHFGEGAGLTWFVAVEQHTRTDVPAVTGRAIH